MSVHPTALDPAAAVDTALHTLEELQHCDAVQHAEIFERVDVALRETLDTVEKTLQ